jgi:hypothetical protein
MAPAWHTLVLVAAIVLLSLAGAKELSGRHAAHVNRMQTYAFTIASEAAMLGWVYLGLRLRKVPFRSILGKVSGGFRGMATDFGVALVFWLGSLFLLGTLNVMWQLTSASIEHRSLLPNGKPSAAQQHTLHTLTGLAPGSASEVVVWVLLCITAGFTEEVVFRGYLQRQFTAWGRGAVAVGVVFSALLFGFAHGYQGASNMVLLSVFGVLFSLLAIFRRNLRACIFAHAWQDLVAGLALAWAHARHLI